MEASHPAASARALGVRPALTQGRDSRQGEWRWSEDGSLDTGFGDSGTTILPMSDYASVPRAVALQSDGKIVVAGSSHVESAFRFAIVRFDSDGQLDPSFDDDGIVFTDVGETYSEARAVLIQPDGRIVAAGTSVQRGFNAFAVARYLPDGTLDSSFSGDGKLTTGILPTTWDQAESIAIQEDDKLVVAGSTEGNYENHLAAVIRYNPNGLLDSTFDDDGKLTLALGGGYTFGRAVAMQADGKIVLTAGNDSAMALARLQPDGSLDAGFGSGGVSLAVADSHYGLEPSALTIQNDGRILVGGTGVNGMGKDFALARFEATDCGNGALDGEEHCDDGNLVSEDGCSAGCRLEPCGPAPAVGCKVPLSSGGARIMLKDHPDDQRDGMTWRWSDGPATDIVEFGDPLTTHDYWLCVYDAGQRIASTLVPRGGDCGNRPCWAEDVDKFSLRSGNGLPEGATQLALVAGDDGHSSVAFRGRGVSLEMPPAASIAGPLVVQLARGDGGLCMSSTFSAPFDKQDGFKLSARSD